MIHISIQDPTDFKSACVSHFLESQGLSNIKTGRPWLKIQYGGEKGDADIHIPDKKTVESHRQYVKHGEDRYQIHPAPYTLQGEPMATYDDGRAAISLMDNTILFGFDVFAQIGKTLSGDYDSRNLGKEDSEGSIPHTDLAMKSLVDAIQKALEKKGKPLIRKSKWPHDAPYAVCLTHDVDEVKKTYQYLTGPLKYLVIGKIGKSIEQAKNTVRELAKGENPYWTFDNLMQLEDELGVRSALYFLQEKGKINPLSPKSLFLAGRRYRFRDKKVAEIIKKLDGGGWEVGVHGSYNSFNNPGLHAGEKKELDEVVGKETMGTRQHHLNYVFPITARIHEKSNIKYDTSLGFKNRTGFKWASCTPFHPFDKEKDRIIPVLEYPTVIMDTPLFYLKENAWPKIEKMLDVVRNAGGLFTILWHHAVFNEREFPGWMGHYQNLIKACQKDGAWIARGDEIHGWWTDKNKAEVKVNMKDKKLSVEWEGPGGLAITSAYAGQKETYGGKNMREAAKA